MYLLLGLTVVTLLLGLTVVTRARIVVALKQSYTGMYT